MLTIETRPAILGPDRVVLEFEDGNGTSCELAEVDAAFDWFEYDELPNR